METVEQGQTRRNLTGGRAYVNFAAVIVEACAGSGWFKLPFIFLQTLPPDEAVLYAYLVDQCKQLDAHLGRTEGWFYCTVRKIKKDVGIGPRTQTRVIKSLQRKGYIHTKKIGIPAKRHILIDPNALGELISDGIEKRRELQSHPIGCD